VPSLQQIALKARLPTAPRPNVAASERSFATATCETLEMTDEQTITTAIDLAEQLLDEVTCAEPRWEAVGHLADALGRLAAGASPRTGTAELRQRDVNSE
jgi:hypothetical protein